MLVLVVAVAGGLLAGALLGGSLANLERLSLRLASLVVLALLLQISLSLVGARLSHDAVIALHIGSYLLFLVCVAANIRRPPVMCFGLGVLSNAVTIVLNGGYMPASRAALRLAGLPVSAIPHRQLRARHLGRPPAAPGRRLRSAARAAAGQRLQHRRHPHRHRAGLADRRRHAQLPDQTPAAVEPVPGDAAQTLGRPLEPSALARKFAHVRLFFMQRSASRLPAPPGAPSARADRL